MRCVLSYELTDVAQAATHLGLFPDLLPNYNLCLSSVPLVVTAAALHTQTIARTVMLSLELLAPPDWTLRQTKTCSYLFSMTACEATSWLNSPPPALLSLFCLLLQLRAQRTGLCVQLLQTTRNHLLNFQPFCIVDYKKGTSTLCHNPNFMYVGILLYLPRNSSLSLVCSLRLLTTYLLSTL